VKSCSTSRREVGLAFPAVVILTALLIVIMGGLLALGLDRHAETELEVHRLRALNAAEAGITRVVDEIWRLYLAAPPETRTRVVDELDGKVSASNRIHHQAVAFADSEYDVTVTAVTRDGIDHADVTLVAFGRSGSVERRITTVVRYGRRASQVFDYAYFINNFGWLWGSTITVNGDVRSNGDFSLSDATVNGDVHASRNDALSALGTISGSSRHDSLTDYRSGSGPRSRPTNPTSDDTSGADSDGNGVPDAYEYPAGYDGQSDRHAAQDVIDMPYLGDMSIYEDLATRRGGTIRIDGVLVVDAKHTGTLVLEGTAAKPIVIDGPVVATGDVVLKGVVRGQGTIYAGRNVHIAGNIRYETPPTWTKPTTTPETEAQANANADLLGLVARGSVILGDYTDAGWTSSTAGYMRPPFTRAYEVAPTDADIGYVTGGTPSNPTFHGDYTAADGGAKADGSARHFFESSLSDADFTAFADPVVDRIDAVIYTNHVIAGRIGETVINGTVVCRDEALLYSSRFTLDYDVRVHGNGYESIDIHLPRAPMRKLLLWREGS
jgi:hypothetical protein